MKRRIKMRKRLSTIMAIVAALSMLFIAGPVMAADNDTQIVNYEVQAINEISTAGTVTLTVDSATAGSAPDQATDSSTYNITTNCAAGAKKITAALDGEPVTGLTFGIYVTNPSSGSEVAAAELVASAAARDVVTAIGAVNESDLAINYTLDATVAANVADSAQKTITLTIVNQS
jgi:hypothetical protein